MIRIPTGRRPRRAEWQVRCVGTAAIQRAAETEAPKTRCKNIESIGLPTLSLLLQLVLHRLSFLFRHRSLLGRRLKLSSSLLLLCRRFLLSLLLSLLLAERLLLLSLLCLLRGLLLLSAECFLLAKLFLLLELLLPQLFLLHFELLLLL